MDGRAIALDFADVFAVDAGAGWRGLQKEVILYYYKGRSE
jgi:hypothetical protein